MRFVTVAVVGGLLLTGSNPVFAQDDEDEAVGAVETAGAEGAANEGGEEGASQPAAGGSGQAYAVQEERFPIRRGLFAEGDFGVFFTLGGRNTNSQSGTLPSRGTSNIQPYVGILVGYDLVSTDTVNFAAGFKGALMLNGGAGRVTSAQVANSGDPNTPCRGGTGDDLCTISNDYEVWEVGVGGALDYLLTDRLGLAFKLDGGLALLNPSPFEPANEVGGDSASAAANYANAGKVTMGGIFSASAGVSYATLLTGFTVGVDVRFSGVVGGGFIPALSVTVPIKYNF